jgi:hypothetical protein
MRNLDPRFSKVVTDRRFRRIKHTDYGTVPDADPRFRVPFEVEPAGPVRAPAAAPRHPSQRPGEEDAERVLYTEVDIWDSTGSEEVSFERADARVDAFAVSASASDDSGEAVPRGEPTRRLALVNMDWNHISAVDILAVMRSLAPAGGKVLRVSVYPTALYLSRAEKEAKYGPQFDYDAENLSSDDDLMPKTTHELEEKQKREIELIRRYEKLRMRYFFAVIECDSVVTASALYDAADGIEFERSSNFIDLRFIPDLSHEFESRSPRDTADTVPFDYAPQPFATRALQHSNVQLTWDADDQRRLKKLQKRRFTEDELKDEDFKAYLASSTDSEGDHDRDAAWIDAYRKRLLGSDELGESAGSVAEFESSKPDRDVSDGNSDVDMEVTYIPSLERLGQRIITEREKRELQHEETRLLARENKRSRRAWRRAVPGTTTEVSEQNERNSNEGASGTESNEHLMNRNVSRDPLLVAYSSREDAASDTETQPATRSDLLSSAASGLSSQHPGRSKQRDASAEPPKAALSMEYDSAHANAGQRRRRRKEKRSKASTDVATNLEMLPFNPDDERFRAIYEDHEFAIDPTNPRFSRSKEANVLLLRKRLEKRRSRSET